jgi:hypothetical protein
MAPAGHGHDHQGASPAASPGRSLDRETKIKSILASPAHRSESVVRRPPVPADPALTRFSSDGLDKMRRRHPSHLIWANAMESAERVVIRNAAATFVLVYLLATRVVRPITHYAHAEHYVHSGKRRVLGKARHYGTRCRRRTRGQELLTFHRALNLQKLTALRHERSQAPCRVVQYLSWCYSNGMMSMYFHRQIILSPASCWIF